MRERQWSQVTVSKQYREHAFCKRRPRLRTAVKSKSVSTHAEQRFLYLAPVSSANTTENRPLLAGYQHK